MPDSSDVDAYIAAAPKAAQPQLRQLRKTIKDAAPKAEEKISYGMPYYRYHGHLVYFGIHKDHIGLYPSGEADRSTELKRFVTGRGTFQFPLGEPLPLTQITALVKRRAKENEARDAAKQVSARRSPKTRSAPTAGARVSRGASR